jgi:anti-sigma-K factor RskA
MTASATQTAAGGRSRWASITPWVLAAGLGVACAVLGARLGSLNEELGDESKLVSNLAIHASRAQQVLEVLSAPDAQHVTLSEGHAASAPSAHTIYVADRGALVMEASHLPPPPAGKTYELWLLPADGSAPVPAGTFRPGPDGAASLVLPRLRGAARARGFSITLESTGGAAAPTLPPVLSGE